MVSNKYFVIFSILSFLFSFSQERDTINFEEDYQIKIFVGTGALYNPNYNINSYLEKNGIVTLNSVEINFTTGLNFYNEILDIDLGYEMFAGGNSNEITKYRTISNGVKLRTHYVFLNTSKVGLGAGFNFGYNKRKLALFWKDYNVDFDDLEPGVNGNQLTMFIEKAYLGPSVSFKIKDVGRRHQQTKFTLAYEFALNNKEWESDFFNLTNTIRETNSRQIILNVTFGL